jgi:predicted O-linked N-acetylglucosamine transferase (SPINDLY family)
MRILQAVEGSILWLLTDNAAAAENLRREAEAQGISGTRLVFARPLPLSQHLARYGLVDLFLDTFPCGAHTTASDALWCGVPVVTRMGESFVARVAASILRAVDLPDMVTTSQEDYEARAVELALAPGRLAAIRSRLADNKPRAPLFDTRLCTRHLEMGYRQIYERYHSDLGVDHIQVSVN